MQFITVTPTATVTYHNGKSKRDKRSILVSNISWIEVSKQQFRMAPMAPPRRIREPLYSVNGSNRLKSRHPFDRSCSLTSDSWLKLLGIKLNQFSSISKYVRTVGEKRLNKTPYME